MWIQLKKQRMMVTVDAGGDLVKIVAEDIRKIEQIYIYFIDMIGFKIIFL